MQLHTHKHIFSFRFSYIDFVDKFRTLIRPTRRKMEYIYWSTGLCIDYMSRHTTRIYLDINIS